MPPDSEGDYEVGYGKPPRETRFAKGQSGNPRGRPSGAKNFKTLLSEALNEPVIVTENGGRRKVTKRQAIITSARQPLGYGGLARDQDPARLGARPRGPDRAGILRDLRLQRGGREGDRAAQNALLERGKVMSERLTPAEYKVLLRHDFAIFAMRCFHDLNPQTRLAMNWHLRVIAAKLTAVREERSGG